MKFDDLDKTMRAYEEALDIVIVPNLPIVVRLDGRGFTSLTKQMKFNKPFDNEFKERMCYTTQSLIKDTGFNFIYGYTQSDEISLLLHPDDNTFSRKLRKLNSVLAGEASACMSVVLNTRASFDCRVIQLPTLELIQDYFSWRQEDAHRNSLNSLCFWTLVKEGKTPRAATSCMNRVGKIEKLKILLDRNIDFNNIPIWQRYGIGFYNDSYIKEGFNPITQEPTMVVRNRLVRDENLLNGAAYREYINSIWKSS